MNHPRPCIVCGACAQLSEGMTPEVVVVGAVLHGFAAGALPGARPSLCPEHDRVRAMLLATLAQAEAQETSGALRS